MSSTTSASSSKDPSLSSSTLTLTLSVHFNKAVHIITLPSSSTLATLLTHLTPTTSASSASSSTSHDTLTAVHLYKVITKGKTFNVPGPYEFTPLDQLSFLNGQKVMVIVIQAHSVIELDQCISYQQRHDETLKKRQLESERVKGRTIKGEGVVHIRDTSQPTFSTLSSLSTQSNAFGFEKCVALPSDNGSGGVVVTPFYNRRIQVLKKLSQDAGIVHLMKKYEWKVGVLGELHPLLDPTLLGVNENRGMRIRLRLLTDRLDGLRAYKTVRRVLIHELAHMRFGPHDDDFKIFDSSLAKQLEAFESTLINSGHRLGGDLGPDVYEPTSVIEESCASDGTKAVATVAGQVLGGGQAGRGDDGCESVQQRRDKAAEAAAKRAQT